MRRNWITWTTADDDNKSTYPFHATLQSAKNSSIHLALHPTRMRWMHRKLKWNWCSPFALVCYQSVFWSVACTAERWEWDSICLFFDQLTEWKWPMNCFVILRSANGKDYWTNVKRLDALTFNVIKLVQIRTFVYVCEGQWADVLHMLDERRRDSFLFILGFFNFNDAIFHVNAMQWNVQKKLILATGELLIRVTNSIDTSAFKWNHSCGGGLCTHRICAVIQSSENHFTTRCADAGHQWHKNEIQMQNTLA